MLGGTREFGVGLAGIRFHGEVAVAFGLGGPRAGRGGVAGRDDVVVWFVEADVAGLDERGFDVEGVDFVEHGFDEAFDDLVAQ